MGNDLTKSSSTVSSSSHTIQGDWKDILFEIRVLLHEPIRYHPNIVRLLGIQWGLSPISESTYPVLLMEYASLGMSDHQCRLRGLTPNKLG